jgi:4'-phosphopantetheinyl transferase
MESGRRRRFTVARGLLRTILARYRDVEPGTLCFTYGEQGKPSLAEIAGGPPLQFSVAHCGDLALYAVAPDRRVGVDVERIRADFGGERIAERFFSAAEIRTLRSTPDDAKPRAFFNCWTRKEAFIKATGNSILQALKSFDVSLAPGEPAALLRTHEDPTEAERWSLRDLDVDAGYAAALAVEGHEWNLSCWQWPP